MADTTGTTIMAKDADDKRAEQVLALLPSVELVAAGARLRVYSVPSRSHPESPNVVVVWGSGQDRRARCTCEARKHCAHIAAALMVEDQGWGAA